MIDLLDYAPIAATAFAVPQFLPQILKLRATHDTAGVSWSWATLTSLNNAAWIAYFVLARYWTALVPASSAVLLAGTLAATLTFRGRAKLRPLMLISSWAVMLGTAYGVAGRAGLGTLLTAAFAVQVAPAIWTAYRTARPTGISSGTWMLILGELTCWLIFGLHKSDPRLITLGVTGVSAGALMLTRVRSASGWGIKQRSLLTPQPEVGRFVVEEHGQPPGAVLTHAKPVLDSLINSNLVPSTLSVPPATIGSDRWRPIAAGGEPGACAGSRCQDGTPACPGG